LLLRTCDTGERNEHGSRDGGGTDDSLHGRDSSSMGTYCRTPSWQVCGRNALTGGLEATPRKPARSFVSHKPGLRAEIQKPAAGFPAAGFMYRSS